MLLEWNRLSLGSDDILYRKTSLNQQVVLPRQLRLTIFKELHEHMGHLGVERVFDLAKSRFYWPNMKEDITHYVTKVCRCLKQKPPAMKQREPLQPSLTQDTVFHEQSLISKYWFMCNFMDQCQLIVRPGMTGHFFKPCYSCTFYMYM